MTARNARIVTSVALVIALAAVAGACGSDGGGALPSTIAVTSTAYVTVPARSTTTTAAPPPAAVNASGNAAGAREDREADASDDPTRERIHEIKAGDHLVGIARDYDVPINHIPAYNGWTDGLSHHLVPGDEIRIPPSDWSPEGEGGDDTTAASDGSADESAGECENGDAPETYKIKAGDTPDRVARAHGVTVAELDAANANTRHYGGFVVGITINIPC